MPPSPPDEDDPPPDELPEDDDAPPEDDELPEELEDEEAPEDDDEPPEEEELPDVSGDPPPLLLPHAVAQQRTKPRPAGSRCRFMPPMLRQMQPAHQAHK
jgi:hypothetical protein